MAINSFYDRLRFVLADRKPHPWGADLAISPATIGRMCENHVPNADLLARIARVENVSLNWLLYGDGAPFVVATGCSDEESRELLKGHLRDEHAWKIHLVGADSMYALVLTQPCAIAAEKHEIQYTCVEIIAGAGPRTLASAIEARTRHALLALDLTGNALHRLCSGTMGNYELLGWRSTPGLLSAARTPPAAQLKQIAKLALESNSDARSSSERDLLDRFRSLPDEQKNAVLTIMKK